MIHLYAYFMKLFATAFINILFLNEIFNDTDRDSIHYPLTAIFKRSLEATPADRFDRHFETVERMIRTQRQGIKYYHFKEVIKKP